MKKHTKQILAIVLSLLVVAMLVPSVFAAGAIDVEKGNTLTLDYHDGDIKLAEADFSIYKVASIDAYGEVTLTEEFKDFPINSEDIKDAEKWAGMLETLKGDVCYAKLAPYDIGVTDENGMLKFPTSNDVKLQAGIYFVMGSMITASNFEVYSPMPFMVKLPVENTEAHNWEYELTVVPKFEKGDDLLLKIGTDGFSIVNGIMPKRVIKVWDDEGYEAIRPEQVEIKLLKDGEVFDTKILSKKTNWRCSWNRLDSSSEWSIVETPIEHYSPLIVHEGGTYTVTNRYIPAISEGNPPVNKKVIGNPDKPGTFEFVMKAQDASFPMPEGSTAGEKTISITGAGSCEFGEMTFDKAGTYVYTMSEKDLAEKGYTYDSNVFTVTFVVTEKDGKLETVRTIKDGNGKDAEYVEFTNNYKSTDPQLPYTGILWWPVPVLLAVGLACILVGVIRRRGKVTEA